MHERAPREGEVKAFLKDDRRSCISIVRRTDGNFCLYEDWYNNDEDGEYWSMPNRPLAGIYANVDDAEREARSIPGYQNSN